MKKLSYLFIIAGILIASYPKLSDVYTNYWQQKLLEELAASDQQQEELIEINYTQLNEIFEEEREVFTNEEVEEEAQEEVIENTTVQQAPKSNIKVIGTIEIPKINLRLPVLEGTSKTNLNRGAGHLTGTSLPGEVGNSAIAAHRGYKYGSLFNRLDELEIDDSIIIQVGNTNYQYTVYEKKVVEPTDTSVLNRNSRDKVLTLITCTPLYEATHRLIIHAKME